MPRWRLVEVEGTRGWFSAILSDDDAVPIPQITCVDSLGKAVLRGDDLANKLAYLRVAAVFVLGILALETLGVGVGWPRARNRG